MRNLVFSFLVFLFLISCKKENNYQIPTSYNFENVNYNGQKYRIQMLSELISYAETACLPNSSAVDATILKNMYNNSGNPFNDSTLNSSAKNLKDKTVSTEQAVIEQLLDSFALISNYSANLTPGPGNPGIMQDASGTKNYLVNSNGVELVEIIEKALMGACFYYQATAVYFGSGQMDVDNSIIVPGEGTAMEHHWDEAFGYLGVPVDFPLNLNNLNYWGKYCNARESVLGLNATIMNGFLKGRAAISNDDLGTRDAQILIIRRNWELITASTAISYLNVALNNFSTDPAVKHHALSEAWGFVYALKWGGGATIPVSTVNSILVTMGISSNPLEINFYNITALQLQNAKEAIVAAFPGLASKKDSL